MAAVVQICDSHLTEGFEVGKNFTDSSITDLLRDVRAHILLPLHDVHRFELYFRPLLASMTQCLYVSFVTLSITVRNTSRRL